MESETGAVTIKVSILVKEQQLLLFFIRLIGLISYNSFFILS